MYLKIWGASQPTGVLASAQSGQCSRRTGSPGFSIAGRLLRGDSSDEGGEKAGRQGVRARSTCVRASTRRCRRSGDESHTVLVNGPCSLTTAGAIGTPAGVAQTGRPDDAATAQPECQRVPRKFYHDVSSPESSSTLDGYPHQTGRPEHTHDKMKLRPAARMETSRQLGASFFLSFFFFGVCVLWERHSAFSMCRRRALFGTRIKLRGGKHTKAADSI